jgi:molybdopterin/thiamine biosynthesis adenylyltransferase
MTDKCRIRIARDDYDVLINHLFPGDQDEHGAVLLAGMSKSNGQETFFVREVHLAKEGTDYVESKIGYRALSAQFIHKMITRARDEKLAYLAVHNHASDQWVGFSNIDLESHKRGYPALLQISRGIPVGALVFGRRSIEADVWLADGRRLGLDQATVVGSTIQRLTPSPRKHLGDTASAYDRQIKMFGKMGQSELAACRVAILGLGGIGSLVAEYLARLGVGHFILVDGDLVEESNLSRIVGASRLDAAGQIPKVSVAERIIREANPEAEVQLIEDDIAKESVANELAKVDYLFLAADSMRARLVFNGLVHQYLIPGVQLGSKIRSSAEGSLIDVMSANRPVRPGHGCLWCNQLIDTNILAKEAKTDEERKDQAYGVEEANPSVISLNAISAAHAANDFLLDYLSLRAEPELLHYEEFHLNKGTRRLVQPRRDVDCTECSHVGLRFGRGDAVGLPCVEG